MCERCIQDNNHMKNTLTVLEKDQLIEVINIGASHASNALAKIIEKRVWIDVPKEFMERVEKVTPFIGEAEKVMTVVVLKVQGDISGIALLVFSPEDAIKIAKLVTKSSEEELVLDDFGRSAIAEVSNILLGTSLAALSNFLDMSLLQSIPDLATDMLGSVIDGVIAEVGEVSGTILGFKVDLWIDDEVESDKTGLRLFFIFDPGATEKILEKVKYKTKNG